MPYVDSFARSIEYLRVSVTDRCNLRCRYCMPEEGVPPIPHEAVLRYEEITRLVRIAVTMASATCGLPAENRWSAGTSWIW